MCYGSAMAALISVRELRNDVSAVLRRVEAGERLTVTVDRRPVAELVPLARRRQTIPWAEFQARIAPFRADTGLLRDLHEIVPDTTDDLWTL
jgi:prevent-host-death family protein